MQSSQKKIHLSFENILWIGGCVILIAALLFALFNNWELLTSAQKYSLALIPFILMYAGALLLSFLQKLALLKNCLYIAFGILCPTSLCVLLLSSHPTWEPAYLMIPPILLMLIPSLIYRENSAKIFLLFYFIATYLMLMGMVPSQHKVPDWMIKEAESLLLGVLLLGIPNILPFSWKSPVKPWAFSLGAFFILVSVSLNIFNFGSWYDAYSSLSFGFSFLIILCVLGLSIYLQSRIIFVEVLIFYVFDVLQFGMLFFKNSPTLWPLILGATGLGWILLGFIYLKFKRPVSAINSPASQV